MTRHPPPPPHTRLDAEERALAALLPRPQGRSEPSAELDSRILAAAAAGLQPQPAKRRPRRSWIAPVSVAASLVLAVGLAWQLRPPPAPAAHDQAAAAASAESNSRAVLAIETPPASPSVPMPVTEPRPMAAMTVPAESTPVAKSSSPAATREQAEEAAIADAAFAAAPPAPPPPAPVVVAGEVVAAQVAAPQASESAGAAAPAMAKARASTATRERSEASANAATQAADAAQRAAADAITLDTVTLADDPGEDVPPATADAPEVRDAWLRRIGELLKQGKTEEAKASLAEFKRRYPQANLPAELRKLEP